MPKKEFPKYRCQKSKDGKPDRAFVELGGKKRYLGVYGTPQTSPESWKKYRHLWKQWYANDCRLAITTVKTGILVKELAVHYLRWAEVRYKEVPQSYAHCRAAMQLLVDHFGEESTDNFTKHSLRFLQKVLVEKGVHGKPYARPTVNRYVGIIRMAFVEGEEQGWGVADSTVTSLKLVRNLKLGKTTAREYLEGKPVPWEIVDQTLPYMPPIVRDMVRVQRLIGGRPQDVRNMRLCDINRDSPIPEYPDVWEYRPFKHKTKYLGKELVKRIGYQAQAILLPYF